MKDPMKQLHEMTESWDSMWTRATAGPKPEPQEWPEYKTLWPKLVKPKEPGK